MLFADLVSYTTLAESRDTEDVRDLLSRYFDTCRTIVKRYGGTVEKFIGDAVMAVWGTPVAHEDDAERAVRAALEMVTGVAALGESLAVPGLALRAGVVTGEVAATTHATDQGMVAGDPVNTAARIQGLAGTGEVWVDTNTRALTAASVTYVDMGEHTLKGKSAPVPLFRVGAVVAVVGGSQRVDGLEAPLAGRARELRLLKELFHATEESGRPRLVVIDGEAGLGKSRLAWEFEKYVDGLSTAVRWHRGRCLSYGDGVAFWALSEAVRGRLGQVDVETPEDPSEALDRTLEEYVDNTDERTWLRPRLASLLGESRDEFRRDDLFAAWTRFFERVGGPRDPVVWVIEDGQHADAGLLDFLDSMLVSAQAAIFVLLLARPQLLARRPELGGRRATVIRLDPINDDAMARLVEGLVEAIPAAARDGLVRGAEGVPLYAVEMVRALIDRDLVRASGGRYVVAAPEALDLSSMSAPASLRALVAARLDTLSPEERRVVTAASVLGMSFTRQDLGFLTADLDLDEVLLRLQHKEILGTDRDRFSAEQGQWRFVQSVIRQIAYSTLSRRDRKVRHIAVAEHLLERPAAADDLAAVAAQHLVDAIDAAGPADGDVPDLRRRAADLLSRAGERASALGSYSDAAGLFESALEKSPHDGDALAALHEAAAEARMELAQYDAALKHADAALDLRDRTGDPVASAKAATLRALALVWRGENRAAIDFLRPRYDDLELTPASREAKLRLALTLGWAFYSVSDFAGMQAVQDTGLRLAEELDQPQSLARAMSLLAIEQAAHGSVRVGNAVTRDIISLTTENELWPDLAVAQMGLGLNRMHYSPRDAAELQRAALDTSREHGLTGRAEVAYANLAIALWTVGEWRQLDTLIREYLEASKDHYQVGFTIITAVDQWRVDAGLSPLVERTNAELDADDVNSRAWRHHVRMLDAGREGRLEQAASDGAESVRLMLEDAGFNDDFMHVWPSAVRAAVAARDLPLAAELVALVGDAAASRAGPALRAHLLVLRGLVTAAQDGDPDAIEADLEAGVSALDEYGSPPHCARAREDLGTWLLACGRVAEGRHQLEAARVTYEVLGASGWLRRLDAEVSARPVHPS